MSTDEITVTEPELVDVKAELGDDNSEPGDDNVDLDDINSAAIQNVKVRISSIYSQQRLLQSECQEDTSGSTMKINNIKFNNGHSGSILRNRSASEVRRSTDTVEKEISEIKNADSEELSANSFIQEELKVQPSFFDTIVFFPTMDDVSIDERVFEDEMEFSEEEVEEDVYLEGVEYISYEEELTVQVPEDDELLVLLEMEKEEIIAKPVDVDVLLKNFLTTKQEEETVVKADEMDPKELKRMEYAKLLKSIAEQFLHKLIDEAVEKSVYLDPREVLRSTLDKREIFDKICILIREMEIEQKVGIFLNRKAVDYFRRRENYQALCIDDRKQKTYHTEKLEGITKKLNEWLGREQELKTIEQNKIANFKSAIENFKLVMKEKEESFEELLKETFKRKSLQHFREVVVKRLLQQISAVREEMAKVRLQLFLEQHNKAILKEKLHELEYLGNGLHMREYESLHTDVILLGKKVEERNSDLKRARFRYNQNTHIYAHSFETSEKLHNFVLHQKVILNELIENRSAVRQRLNKLKLEQKVLRGEVQHASNQCGLLDKPALLRDYDVTNEQLMKARQRVDQLRTEHRTTLQRIENLNRKLSKGKDQSLIST